MDQMALIIKKNNNDITMLLFSGLLFYLQVADLDPF